jgi:uncharacterized LabA/DUF88 family protein
MVGPVGGSPYTGPKEIHYLFIDGGALRGRLENLSRRFFSGASLRINFEALVRNFTKAFYYDALPVRNEGESEGDYEARIKPQRDVFEAAACVDRVHVYEGDARRRRKRGYEQKKVDVMLTVDMLTHTFRKNMHQATLLTGDNDFKPLVDALVQDGMFVNLWFPVDETSRELMQAADARHPLSMLRLHDFLTAESRKIFNIPKQQNFSSNLPSGTELVSWELDGKRCGLFERYGQYVVTRDADQDNRLHIMHDNLELLKYFCHDSIGIDVPDIQA